MATVTSVETDLGSLVTTDQGTVGIWFIDNLINSQTNTQNFINALKSLKGICMTLEYTDPETDDKLKLQPNGPR